MEVVFRDEAEFVGAHVMWCRAGLSGVVPIVVDIGDFVQAVVKGVISSYSPTIVRRWS